MGVWVWGMVWGQSMWLRLAGVVELRARVIGEGATRGRHGVRALNGVRNSRRDLALTLYSSFLVCPTLFARVSEKIGRSRIYNVFPFVLYGDMEVNSNWF